MHLIPTEPIIILLSLTAMCLVFNLIKSKKIKEEPLLVEKAVVQDKPYKTNRFDNLFTVDFLIVERDTVAACKVPYDIWEALDVGQKGTLTHKSGFIRTFESDGVVYTANYPSGITL